MVSRCTFVTTGVIGLGGVTGLGYFRIGVIGLGDCFEEALMVSRCARGRGETSAA